MRAAVVGVPAGVASADEALRVSSALRPRCASAVSTPVHHSRYTTNSATMTPRVIAISPVQRSAERHIETVTSDRDARRETRSAVCRLPRGNCSTILPWK